MSLYNVHKRATLDRISLRYQLGMRIIMRDDAETHVRDMFAALNAGRRSFDPSVVRATGKVSSLFEAHRENVIHVGVSDGIQEISPDAEMGLWESHDVYRPVEDTLTVALQKKRAAIIPGIRNKVEKKQPDKTKKLTKSHLSEYLDNIRKVYREVAKGWQAGESDLSEVQQALSVALRLTDNDAKRTFTTETTTYFNETRHSYFSQNTVADYVELYAVTDGRISKICEDRHGFVVPMALAGLKKYMPAFHPHCRTIQRALISRLISHMKIIEAGLRMSESSFTPLPKNWAA